MAHLLSRQLLCVGVLALLAFPAAADDESKAAASSTSDAPASSTGHDWPQFRGVDRSGISGETGLLASWPDDGPKELWRRPIGEGYSAITAVGDRLFTMFAVDAVEPAGAGEGAKEAEATGIEYAVALDARTGEELWRTETGPKHETEFGNGPRSTPTVDGDLAYVLGARGRLAALDIEDGSVRWSLELTDDFGAEVPHWGFSTSSVVHGDKLFLETGGKESKTHAALDKRSGELLWTLGDRGAGYNSPLVVEVDGKQRFIYVSGDRILGLDDAGKEIWSHPWPQGETHAMPVAVGGNRIFASGAEGVGAMVLEIEEGDEAKDEAKVAEIWTSRFMRNHFSSSVYHDGYLYGFDNATLKCIAATDGTQAWAKRGLGKGSLILADGKLLVLSDRGKLLMVEATPEAFRQLGEAQALEGLSWTAPSLAHGRLFVRNHSEIAAYDLRDDSRDSGEAQQ